MKIFLDANIVIDFLDSDRKSHESSKKLLEKCILEGNELVISEDILTTVHYVCRKNISDSKIFDFFEMMTQEFEVVGFGEDVIKESIKFSRKNSKFDFEDVLQCVCAKKNKCDLVVSNDKKFPAFGCKVKNLAEFLR